MLLHIATALLIAKTGKKTVQLIICMQIIIATSS